LAISILFHRHCFPVRLLLGGCSFQFGIGQSFFVLADLADADPILALWRDVKNLGGSFDRGMFVGRVYLAQVFRALADDVYRPAGHSLGQHTHVPNEHHSIMSVNMNHHRCRLRIALCACVRHALHSAQRGALHMRTVQ
jgi:hypothetical protein